MTAKPKLNRLFGFPAKEWINDQQNYLLYVKKGIYQGRRPELVGGGLVRSLGGWSAEKKLRLKGHDRVKGDERILGDGEKDS